MEFILHLGVG